MRRTVVLFLAVVAVLCFVALNYQVAAQQQPAPQAPTTVRWSKVRSTGTQVSGRIIGFSCVQPGNEPECIVGTTD